MTFKVNKFKNFNLQWFYSIYERFYIYNFSRLEFFSLNINGQGK